MIQSKPRWLRYLPVFLRNRIQHRPNLLAILSNTGWLFADKILRMGVGFFVGVWVARYLGPEQFGLWNFAIAFTALFGAFATLGLDGIVVRELVKNPERHNVLLGTALALKLIGAVVALILATAIISLVRKGETFTLWLVLLSAAGFIFQSVNVVDFYFQSKVKSKYTVYAANSAFILVTFIKIILLVLAAPLIAFAWAGLIELILTAVFLFIAYKINHQNLRMWHFDGNMAKQLLKDSWPLILSGLAITLYTRIDQLMLGQLLGNEAVGIYSAALRFSEIWYFIPVTIAASVYPSIIQTKMQSKSLYLARLQKLYNLMVVLALFVAIPMTFLSDWLVIFSFGSTYIASGIVLSIHIWTSVFVFLGVVNSNFLIAENFQRITFYMAAICGLINIFLNYILIPSYGVVGAAYATLASQMIGVFLNICFQGSRVAFFMQLNALLIYKRLHRKA